MKKLKSFKYKTNGDNSPGIFTKITKRYSNVSFLRGSPGRNLSANASQPTSTGSYDMTGHESEDLKREIGAPVLISKTRIDSDTTDCVLVKTNGGLVIPVSPGGSDGQQTNSPSPLGDNETTKESLSDDDDELPNNLYDEIQTLQTSPNSLNINRSKSATNLHKSEIKVFLHKAPSLVLEKNIINTTIASEDHVPPAVILSAQLQGTTDEQTTLFNNVPRNKSFLHSTQYSSSSVNNVSNGSSKQHVSDLDNFSYYNSKNSLQIDSSVGGGCGEMQQHSTYSRDNLHFYDNNNSSGNEDDFDMKSASFQSLDARNLFLSIEELNEITRQINESEEFGNHEIELEYCEHRDKLRPDQRRITLMRNKNSGGINFDGKKEKISNAWNGLKHWIGEEKVKLKGAMQKHAAMQRVGGKGQSSEHQNGSSVVSSSGAGNSGSSGKDGNIVRNQDFFDRVGKPLTVLDESSQISSRVPEKNLKFNESGPQSISKNSDTFSTNAEDEQSSVLDGANLRATNSEERNGFVNSFANSKHGKMVDSWEVN